MAIIAAPTSRLGALAAAFFSTSPAVTHVQLHTGDPGAAGTSNVAAGVARAALTVPGASGAVVTATATFSIPGAGGPYTHVSLWSASTDGTWCGNDNSPDVTFSAPGWLGYSLAVTGSAA